MAAAGEGSRERFARRPMTRLATAGLAGHVFFEPAAGVGMPFASLLGPGGAAGLWTGTVAVWRLAATRPTSSDAAFCMVSGAALAAVVAHFAAWPRHWTRAGLPWIKECEGLGPELMPAYNTILYVSGAAAVAGLMGENRSAPRGVGLPALGFVPGLIGAQRWEHRRLEERARDRPGWWNRRLRA